MKAKIFFLALLGCSQLFAANDSKDLTRPQEYTQSIHVVNSLANTDLSDPGMTPTAVVIRYFNGGAYPCWISTLNFHDDIIVHAGPNLGCINKINQVVIMPVVVAEKLKTYQIPTSVDIDTTKYSNHITIIQAQGHAPSFDAQSGMVVTPGAVSVQVQSD